MVATGVSGAGVFWDFKICNLMFFYIYGLLLQVVARDVWLMVQQCGMRPGFSLRTEVAHDGPPSKLCCPLCL